MDQAFGDLVERDRDGLVRVDIALVDQRLAREELATLGGRQRLGAHPVVELAGALGRDVDQAELGVGVLEETLEVAECYFFAHVTNALPCEAVSYTHLRAHETGRNLVCR